MAGRGGLEQVVTGSREATEGLSVGRCIEGRGRGPIGPGGGFWGSRIAEGMQDPGSFAFFLS